jgi:hypothetical protein
MTRVHFVFLEGGFHFDYRITAGHARVVDHVFDAMGVVAVRVLEIGRAGTKSGHSGF